MDDDLKAVVAELEGDAARFARAICESEGKEWAGLENSRSDCERWFRAGTACARIARAILTGSETNA